MKRYFTVYVMYKKITNIAVMSQYGKKIISENLKAFEIIDIVSKGTPDKFSGAFAPNYCFVIDIDGELHHAKDHDFSYSDYPSMQCLYCIDEYYNKENYYWLEFKVYSTMDDPYYNMWLDWN